MDGDDIGDVVLPWDATRALSLVEALVAYVPAQQISRLVRALDQDKEAQAQCSHLKRVNPRMTSNAADSARTGDSSAAEDGGSHRRSLAVLLGVGSPGALSADVHAILNSCNADPCIMNLPKHAPLTRRQFDEWNSVWPLHFHQGAAARTLAVWDDAPRGDEHEEIRGHMRRAIFLAQQSSASGGRPVAAVAVRDGARIAECSDGTRAASSSSVGGSGSSSASHPLGHAVMRCIEEVARLERAVAQKIPRKRSAPGLGVADTAVEAGPIMPEPTAEVTGAPSTLAQQPHLCVGCDIYVTLEPCPMCAMALVHSRVRRVFYALAAPAAGSLGSRYQLHAERSLNHHFCAVRGTLQTEAMKAGLAPEDPSDPCGLCG